MTLERTDEQILAKEPLTLKFGTKDHEVPVLTIKKAKAWRNKLVEAVKEIVAIHQTDCTTNDVFIQGLAFFFLEMPEKMFDLVCEYAPSLPREVIEEEATDEQIAHAFSAVMSIAYPFNKQLGMISSVMGIAATTASRTR